MLRLEPARILMNFGVSNALNRRTPGMAVQSWDTRVATITSKTKNGGF